MPNLTIILSLFPLVLFLGLILTRKATLLAAAALTLVIIFLLQVFYWEMLPIFMVNSVLKGMLVAFDIFVIILGAIFFLEVLKDIKIIENLSYYLESFFKDYRVQIILLAWFFENFIEGTAGFGTPSTVVAPILISLGLSPITAVVVALLGNSTSVAFGAAGTPIRVGFEGLETAGVPILTALFNSVGVLVPVFMLWIMAREQRESRAHFFEALPFAIWSGIAFVVPSILIVPLGQEFPSILGSIIGLGLVLVTTRLGFLVPRRQRQLRETNVPRVQLTWIKIIGPYGLLIIFLILGKLVLGSVKLAFPGGLVYLLNLSNPGLAFILAGLPVALLWGRKRLVADSFRQAMGRIWEPFAVIASMSIIVQLMINSGNNVSGIASSLEVMSRGFEVPYLPFLSPMVGAFGSFLTGSATVSNIMFGNFLDKASRVMGMSGSVILSLGLVGAAVGNMISLPDILAAEAVVGLKDKTKYVLRGVIIPCLIYLVLVGIIGMIVIFG